MSEITGIYDKGKGAVVVTESKATLVDTGEPLFDTRMSAFIRGEGGWGGDRGPSGNPNEAPDRDPDHTVDLQTRTDQALLYRLSGDRNPLHTDPAFAAMGGFDRPILHGLCTYGFTGRGLLHALCGSDPARFKGMEARFSSPVMPGEALTVKAWDDGDGNAVFQTSARTAASSSTPAASPSPPDAAYRAARRAEEVRCVPRRPRAVPSSLGLVVALGSVATMRAQPGRGAGPGAALVGVDRAVGLHRPGTWPSPRAAGCCSPSRAADPVPRRRRPFVRTLADPTTRSCWARAG